MSEMLWTRLFDRGERLLPPSPPRHLRSQAGHFLAPRLQQKGNEVTETTDPARDYVERFFEELADFAPVMIRRSGPDALCDSFNKPWLDFVGTTMEQETGNGWAENVHRDDFDRCVEIYLSSFNTRKPFTMSYRLKRHDLCIKCYIWLRRFKPSFGCNGHFGESYNNSISPLNCGTIMRIGFMH